MSPRVWRLAAVAVLATGPLLLAGCTGGGGLAGECDPRGFGPLSGCSGGVEPATQVTAGATYTVLARLVAGAGFPLRHQDDMVAIAMAESSGRLDAVSDQDSDGTYDRCAWQINDVHGYDPDRLVSDPAYCASAAYDVYRIQGFDAWTVVRTGAYRQYLGDARAAVRS